MFVYINWGKLVIHDTKIEIETLKTEEIKNMGMGSKDQEGIPIPLHSFGSSIIVRFVSLITEFQNKYLLKEYECGERFFFGVEMVKEGLRKLDFGLQVAQREIPKYNSRIREWYLKVKDIVYQLEDLFEDIELQVMAESYDSPSLSKDKFEELLKDDGLDYCIHLILFLLLLLLPLLIFLLLPHQH